MTNWNEADHPRVPGGKVNGGQFTDKEMGEAVSAANSAAGLQRSRADIKESLWMADDIEFHQNGSITARRGFFYHMGKSAEDFANEVKTVFPGAVIMESGEVRKPFKGGAPLKNQTHWFVRFRLPE